MRLYNSNGLSRAACKVVNMSCRQYRSSYYSIDSDNRVMQALHSLIQPQVYDLIGFALAC